MPYLGNEPATVFTSTTKDTFSGDGSTTDFTLSKAGNNNALRVVVENVVQDPGVAYSCNGTIMSFTSPPPTGTDNIYVVHLGRQQMEAYICIENCAATLTATGL